MEAAGHTSSGASRVATPASRRASRRRRRGPGALAPAGCLALAGCHLVPAEDVNTFLVDLAPPATGEIDETALAETIRAETHVEEFEFAEELDTGRPRLPAALAHVIRLVAGQ